ncbi:hypothetical protein RCL1_001387 [Eukaryota sp. TZLM3-RCL]
MGIRGLLSFLDKNNSIIKCDLKRLQPGSVIGVDTYNFAYSIYNQCSSTYWYQGYDNLFLFNIVKNFISAFESHGILLHFFFEVQTLDSFEDKSKELDLREEQFRKQYVQYCHYAREGLDFRSDTLVTGLVPMPWIILKAASETKSGITFCSGEGDDFIAKQAQLQNICAVMSADSDFVAFPNIALILLNRINYLELTQQLENKVSSAIVDVISSNKVVASLGLTSSSFIDLALLLGNDFSDYLLQNWQVRKCFPKVYGMDRIPEFAKILLQSSSLDQTNFWHRLITIEPRFVQARSDCHLFYKFHKLDNSDNFVEIRKPGEKSLFSLDEIFSRLSILFKIPALHRGTNIVSFPNTNITVKHVVQPLRIASLAYCLKCCDNYTGHLVRLSSREQSFYDLEDVPVINFTDFLPTTMQIDSWDLPTQMDVILEIILKCCRDTNCITDLNYKILSEIYSKEEDCFALIQLFLTALYLKLQSIQLKENVFSTKVIFLYVFTIAYSFFCHRFDEQNLLTNSNTHNLPNNFHLFYLKATETTLHSIVSLWSTLKLPNCLDLIYCSNVKLFLDLLNMFDNSSTSHSFIEEFETRFIDRCDASSSFVRAFNCTKIIMNAI